MEINNFVNLLNLTKFDIIGHSLGGFLAGHYFSKFPEKINKIYFLSPAGFHKNYPNQEMITKSKWKNYNIFFNFYLKKVADTIFKKKKSFFETFPKFIMKYIIKKYYEQKIFNLNKKETFLLTNLIFCLIDENQYGERGLSYILNYGVKSQKPLIDILKKFPKKQKDFIFIYGKNDWMDSHKSIFSIKKFGLESKFYLLKNSAHFVIVQNPDKLAEVILSFYNGEFENEDIEGIPKL